MDPQATWDRLLDSWSRHDWSDVLDAAEALLLWLDRGGFPPETMHGPELDADWHRALTIAMCNFAVDRANIELNDRL